MLASRRFQSPSASLTLKSLLKRMQRTLWIGLGLAVALHGASTQLVISGEEQRVARPLTTQFVKRQRRLTKPLELKKRPQPKRRRIRRERAAVRTQTRPGEALARFEAAALAGRLARPNADVWRTTKVGAAEMDPQASTTVWRQSHRLRPNPGRLHHPPSHG